MIMIKKIVIITIICFGKIVFSQSKHIPIFAFHGVPPGTYSTKEQFVTMKNAGIDICYTLYNNNEEVLKALDAAQSAGAQLIIKVPSLFNDTENTIKLLRDHPALYGYCIVDEPTPSMFNDIKDIIRKIKIYDSKHVFYVNLFPNYASDQALNGLTYENYLRMFVKQVPASFLSFDYYPVVNNTVRSDWYKNLEDVRMISMQNKIDFWAFACSTIHYNYLQPTLQGLKLQQFGNLLYGAQGLQYFTYWTLTYESNWVKEKYSYSIVDDQGKPTPTYNIVKAVNQQIQRLAWVFYGATVDHVFHTGSETPKGTSKLVSAPKGFTYFSTNGKNAILSMMSNSKSKFIIIQNKSLVDNLILDYKLQKKMKMIDNASGRARPLLASKKYKSTILPGDVFIFNY